jgi:hypothetical protein
MKEFVDDFAWQQGYSGFGVSKSNIPAVVRYMKNQERHDLVRSVAWDLRRVYYRVMSESNQHVCELFARSWRII